MYVLNDNTHRDRICRRAQQQPTNIPFSAQLLIYPASHLGLAVWYSIQLRFKPKELISLSLGQHPLYEHG